MPFVDPAEMIHGSPLTGWTGRFFHSQNMTFAHWDIAPDAAPLHEHHHPQEEVWNVVEGEIALTIDGVERVLGVGFAATVPPDTPHSVRPLGRCRVIVVDYPLRLQLPGVSNEADVDGQMNLGRVSSAALMLSGISAVLTPKQVASALHLSADSDRGVAEARAFWSYLAAEIGFGATALAYATRIEVELSRR